jgi:hypothetical protein
MPPNGPKVSGIGLTQAFEDPERRRQWERQVADLQHKILQHVPSIQFGPPAPE